GSHNRLGKLPIFDHPSIDSGSGSGSGSGSIRTPGSGSISLRGAEGTAATRTEERSSNEPSHPSTLTALSTSPPPDKRGRVYAGIGAVAFVAVAAVGFVATRGSSTPAAPPASTTAPTAEPAAKLHTLSIDSLPQGATV